jgi:bifunctional DNA-binding transcriptional regulator/antitoxin component of YhaV-PrlF toxin-antitoxin module
MNTLHPTAKWQVTIPTSYRKKLKLAPETPFTWEEGSDGALILRPAVVLNPRVFSDAHIAEIMEDDKLDPKDVDGFEKGLQKFIEGGR